MPDPAEYRNGLTAFKDMEERIVRRELVFPPQVEKLAAVCLSRPELFAFDTTSEIAAKAGVSTATVTRFVKLLGMSRIKEARQIFRDELRRRAMRAMSR
jgi:DNA-binding MurR/RpiR family transcriptional regulator